MRVPWADGRTTREVLHEVELALKERLEAPGADAMTNLAAASA
jgi:hypothetical protein